jgi:integrase
VAVYDRWHRDPGPGEQPCKCGKGRGGRLYPSADHLRGRRWQVRWRDPDTGRQKTRLFALRDGVNPGLHAAAFDREIQGSIVRSDYQDPDAGNVTLQAYAEQYRRTRVHGESAAAGLESRLRCHVYPGSPGSDRTPAGGIAIGQHAIGFLARRPSLIAAWLAALPLADGSRLLVLGDVSAVFRAAMEDGAVRADPTESSAVARPSRGRSRARPYAAAEVSALAACMPPRFALVPYLGAGTGMREMEMAGLGADDIARGKAPGVRVTRQLKVIGGELRWGPVKNRKPHGVPVPAELLGLLDAHMAAFPPVAVTLPWHEPGSKLHGTMVTVRLVLSRDGRTPASRNVMDAAWRTGAGRALAAQGIGRSRKRSAARGHGIHRLRHTFASTQLRAGVDVVRVAAWLGDTVAMVTKTYLHLMPDDHDGEAAGRAAVAAFLGACAAPVEDGAAVATSGQLRAV